jgi:hypothetical protein
MRTTPAFAMLGVPRAPRSEIIDVRKLFFFIALLAAATTPSYATTITYNFAARIDVAVAPTPDFTLESVQTGDVLHGTMTINTRCPHSTPRPTLGNT